MAELILPWQRPLWERALAQQARLPHALLFAGPAGGGKRRFAEALAQRLLCQRAHGVNSACGECAACQLWVAGNHLDWLKLVPERDEEEVAEVEGADTGKAKSAQIRIEQVRELQERLTVPAHHGGLRVVLIDPAEAMNPATTNALLKLLEEPPAGSLFLLVSGAPRRLLPTLRSRCQVWPFPCPPRAQALAWLAAQGLADAEALLGFTGGLPLAAAALAGGGGAAARSRFARELAQLSPPRVLSLAAEWENWSRAKTDPLPLADMILWLQRWICDCAAMAQGVAPKYFADCASDIATLAPAASRAAWVTCYREMLSFRKLAQHPLNPRLLLEDLLLRYARVVALARSKR